MRARDDLREYNRKWNRRNPGYHSNWMWASRHGFIPKTVLNVRIDWRYFMPLHTVSKEQAEREFLLLTGEDFL